MSSAVYLLLDKSWQTSSNVDLYSPKLANIKRPLGDLPLNYAYLFELF